MTMLIRRPADPHSQPVPMTQHQMVNIACGQDPDAPLEYIARIQSQGIIGTFKTRFKATSEEHARRILGGADFASSVMSLRIL